MFKNPCFPFGRKNFTGWKSLPRDLKLGSDTVKDLAMAFCSSPLTVYLSKHTFYWLKTTVLRAYSLFSSFRHRSEAYSRHIQQSWDRKGRILKSVTMRILSWVQNKFNGRQEKKRFDDGVSLSNYASTPSAPKEEFSDWPQALLAIGTFGNSELKEESQRDTYRSHNLDPSEEDLPDFTIEEVNKLQKELKELLTRKSKSEISKEDRANLPLNRFLNCPWSLEVDRTVASMKLESLENENNGDLSPNTKIILNKVKDELLGNRNAIKKKSISFLLKKMFTCHTSFAPSPSLMDPIPESRMEKILRAILTKKIQQQSSAPTSSNRHLENKSTEKTRVGEEEDKRHKWVKTDSDFIVLEM